MRFGKIFQSHILILSVELLILSSHYFFISGFTCYWASGSNLWRITQCYFDLYDSYKTWSNVVCVHRSHTKLLERMENKFLSTLADSTLEQEAKFCSSCKGPWGRCAARVTFLAQKYGVTNATQAKLDIMKSGRCINPT